jgi:glucosamine--fructose-6-phosphate aminotransferase (isomerizing)
MCGIVGFVGETSSLQILVDGLKRLEYRGYDSAGIAFQNGKGIEIFKTKGKIMDLENILPDPLPNTRIGLGHTRWATHGVPSELNAHPHTVDGIVVVHNGIIENYRELKSKLESEGHEFISDTDTEVIPQIIASFVRRGLSFQEAITEALHHLKGSYALGIMSAQSPDTLFAARKGSPLVVGIGYGSNFFASDISALLSYTRKFIYLEDEEICALAKDNIEVTNFKSKTVVPVTEKITEINWSPSMAEKNGFEHFMLKEIYEQPRAIMDTIGEWVDDPRNFLEELGINMKTTLDLRRLQIVACGTSYHAGLIGRYMIESLTRVPVDVEVASEYRYKRPIIENGTLFISITQSGETADTLAAQREAKRKGAKTLTICNVVGSTSSREADFVLHTRAGLEIGVASTKAFTAQMTALYLIAISLGIMRGRLTKGEATALKSFLAKIPSLIEKTIKKDSEIVELARSLVSAKGFLYLGRGINYPIALEGALKLKEISYVHAEGYPAGEMKHGPIALIDEGLPVVVIAPMDDIYEKTLSNIEEVKARGGRVIAVTDEPERLRNKVDELIEVPSAHPILSPLINVVPLQLLAYHVGVLKGLDVDQPRNLAKSVTVE